MSTNREDTRVEAARLAELAGWPESLKLGIDEHTFEVGDPEKAGGEMTLVCNGDDWKQRGCTRPYRVEAKLTLDAEVAEGIIKLIRAHLAGRTR